MCFFKEDFHKDSTLPVGFRRMLKANVIQTKIFAIESIDKIKHAVLLMLFQRAWPPNIRQKASKNQTESIYSWPLALEIKRAYI